MQPSYPRLIVRNLLKRACSIAFSFWLLAAGHWDVARATTPQKYDVVVYGATPAGVTAAIAARREGATACLVEPTHLIGGMMSSGLSFSDSNQMARECLLGLFEEFHERVERKYSAQGVLLPYRVSVKDQSHWTYEPHVAEEAFVEMLREAGVELFLGRALTGVEKKDARIVRLLAGQNFAVSGRVFIDASYEGDLMAAAGIAYRIGREGRSAHNESLAGLQFPKEVVPVSPWSSAGKLLPLVTARDSVDSTGGDRKTMAYSFRLCLTDDPELRLPITKPSDYDDRKFELLRRYFTKFPEAPLPIDLYPLPGRKFDANNGIAKQISLGLVGGSWEWAEATPKQREKIWREHRSYAEGLLWFLASDPAVPKAVRDATARYGLAKDEFERFSHWPPALYVREARRMIGAYVLTQHDVLTDVAKPDPIAVGSFPIDSHDCQRTPTDDGFEFVNEGTIYPTHLAGRAIGQPHHIPYRSIIPLPEECVNMLVPVCVSASHVAFSSVRVEPTWMVLGQSSGIAAALIARKNIAVQRLEYDVLKPKLLAQGVSLTLPALTE